jgi:23S rRNA pseudouridine1911/1915/1917 synthase
MDIEIKEKDSGKRVDIFVLDIVKDFVPAITRTLVQDNLSVGCLINKKKCKKSYKLKEGDTVSLDMDFWKKLPATLDLSKDIVAQDGKLDVRYEDNDVLVLYKEKGISVHPGVGNLDSTLANYVRMYLEKKGEYDPLVDRAGIVHRLDKGVSGLMVLAKNKETQEYLKKEFAKRNVIKIYHAQVESVGESKIGMFKNSEQKIDFKKYLSKMDISFEPWKKWFDMRGYIGRSSKNRYKMEFRLHEFSGSKFAESYILKSGNEVMVKIETGRMHQIRASLEYLGLRIVGDMLYGSNGYKGSSSCIMLESVLLSFLDRHGKRLTFTV